MNKDFPRIITLLRKERALSQKKAAADLGISQSLLSHYEKGIRECSLDFLVRTAEYYEVSCDYLLGRTAQKNGAVINVDDIPDSESSGVAKGNMINQINKKFIVNTTSLIFDILAQIGNKKLTSTISNYMMSTEYQIFRTLYSSDKSNSQSMFSVKQSSYRNLCSCAMAIELEIIDELIADESLKIPLSTDYISRYFEKSAPSLYNVIQYTEKNIRARLANA